jgi:hypothetical protein
MRAHGETLLHEHAAAAAFLAGVGRMHREHPTPGACRLGGEDDAEPCPAGIAEARGQGVVPD